MSEVITQTNIVLVLVLLWFVGTLAAAEAMKFFQEQSAIHDQVNI